jgi:uncharacterized protein with GYD domain
MPIQMSRTRTTAETWARQARYPEDRMVASKAGARDYGGEMVGYYYSSGRIDIVAIAQLPDMVTACALESAIYGSGAFLDYDNVWLITVDEMAEATRKAREWPTLRDYKPPGLVGEEKARRAATGEG